MNNNPVKLAAAFSLMLVMGALEANNGDGNKPTVASRQALERQGAWPIDSAGLGLAGFTATGLVLDALPVVQ